MASAHGKSTRLRTACSITPIAATAGSRADGILSCGIFNLGIFFEIFIDAIDGKRAMPLPATATVNDLRDQGS